jgi:Spy/CpxP family protein refolding chaperone
MRKTLIPALAASLFALTLPLGGQAETAAGAGPQAQMGHRPAHGDNRGESRGHGAQAHGSHHGMSGQGGMMRMGGGQHGGGMMAARAWLRGLDLSEAQRDKVFAIMHAQAPKMREQAKLVRAARTELGGLAMAATLDPAQLKAASDKLARAIADMSESRVSTRNQIFQLLTPEQKQQVQARLAERSGRGGEGRGMGHGGHRPGQHGEGRGHGGHSHGEQQRSSAPGATMPTQAG